MTKLDLLLLPLAAAAGLPASAQEDLPAAVTFTEHIAPIVFEHCASCHRPGEIGPFPLLSYHDVKKRARMVQRVTEKRYMPPWHPEPGWGEFRDPRRLTDRAIALIRKWVATGRKEGPRDALPELPAFTRGWQLGEPDLVVSMAEGYPVPASGADIYRNFVVPLELEHDEWVVGVEIRPSARAVLHHSLFFLDDSGRARDLDGRDGKPGFRAMRIRSGSLGGWAVGATPRKLPLGLAHALPAGSDIVLASHFHLSGKKEVEKTTLGLYFADRRPSRTLLGFQVPPRYGALMGYDIPPGEAAYTVTDTFTVPVDIQLVGAGGHAHYICKSMKAVAKLPSGRVKKLFYIKRWDFNWQGRYHYVDPVDLPRGTVITATIVWDNSAANTAQQFDPPRRVRWGLQSTDEMGSVIFSCVAKDEADVPAFRAGVRREMAASVRRHPGSARRGLATRIAAGLRRMDRNGDGKIERSEVPARWRRWVDRLDHNGDGVIDAKEIEAGLDGRRRKR